MLLKEDDGGESGDNNAAFSPVKCLLLNEGWEEVETEGVCPKGGGIPKRGSQETCLGKLTSVK
jgi:hypothetical protein